MTAGIRGYLLAVAAAGILVSLAAALLPKGAMHRTGQFVGSLVLVLAVLSPVAQLDLPDMAKAISGARMEAREADTGIPAGRGCGLLFKKGEIIGRVSEERLCDALLELIESEARR